ncbi:hypothetical protein MLPF_3417 [Mycobacterium lepromatosis]|nr:hypothetical protein MLPF_3417 [Mycobacterium lepromatosis]
MYYIASDSSHRYYILSDLLIRLGVCHKYIFYGRTHSPAVKQRTLIEVDLALG